MRRLCAVAALALVACGTAGAAPKADAARPEPSRNEKFGLEVTFPEKWLVGSGEEPVLLMSRSTDPDAQANCLATGEVVEKTQGLTQGELNQALAKSFGAEFWQGIYARTGLNADVKIAVARAHVSGVVIQEARFDLSKSGDLKTKVSVHQAIFITPGRTISLACSARTSAFPKYKPKLDGVMESVRITKPASPVASAAPGVVAISETTGNPLEDLDKTAAGGAGAAGSALLQLTQ